MKYSHEQSKKKKVSEPVQVYLADADRDRLDRLTDQLETTKSDVLRRGLEALERQISDPDQHPALRIIGIAAGHDRRPLSEHETSDHDHFLAESEAASWKPKKKT